MLESPGRRPCPTDLQIASDSRKRQMDNSVKDRLASQALELLIDFEMALSERKRKYPVQEFFAFAKAARRYVDLTRRDQLVRRDVAVALNDLRERVAGELLFCFGVTM